MITRKIRVSLTKFVGAIFSQDVFLLPGTGGTLYKGNLYLAFRGRRTSEGGGQSDLFASAVFSDSFSSRHLICQGAIAHPEYRLDATIAAT